MAKKLPERGLPALSESVVDIIDSFLWKMQQEFQSGMSKLQNTPKKQRPESVQKNIAYLRSAERAMKTARGRNRQRRIVAS